VPGGAERLLLDTEYRKDLCSGSADRAVRGGQCPKPGDSHQAADEPPTRQGHHGHSGGGKGCETVIPTGGTLARLIGRATRQCPDIGKEVFRIFDAVDLYPHLQNLTDMKPVVVNPSITFEQLVKELVAADQDAIREAIREQLAVKLRRLRPCLTPADEWRACSLPRTAAGPSKPGPAGQGRASASRRGYIRSARCGFVLPRALMKSARLASLAAKSLAESRPRKSS
jgi:hypothetical protein